MMSTPIVFNLTLKLAIDDGLAMVNYLKQAVLPECTDGSIILSSQINKILMGEEDGDHTYAIQFTYASSQVFAEHKLSSMAVFLKKLDERFAGKYVYFTTVMELLHLQNNNI